jgi:opacity protein-like surface antigen
MIRRRFRLLVLSVLVLCPVQAALAGGEINLFVGEKSLDLDLEATEEVLEPLEEQDEYGLLFSYTGGGWPISLAVDLLQAEDDVSVTVAGMGGSLSSTLDVEVSEINIGVRKFFGKKVQGYVGGGVAVANVDLKLTSSLTTGPLSSTQAGEEDDRTFGAWINAGVKFRIGRVLNLGIDGRYTEAEAEIDDADLDIGGTHVGAFLGFRWGGGP